jgi:hypothetical protein
LEDGLADVLNAYLAGGDEAAAQVAQSFGIVIDENGAIEVVVSPSAESDVATVTAIIQQVGGEITVTGDTSVTARLTLAQLLPLVNTPQVGTVGLPEVVEATPEATVAATVEATAEATPDAGASADEPPIVSALASGVGVYDDTSVSAIYTSNWTPQYNALSYNNTLHYTNINNETVQFTFTGDAFTVTLMGNPAGGEFAVSLDPDGAAVTNSLLLLNTAGRTPFGAGFTCSAEISTVNGRVNNVRSANTFYTIGCRGIEANFAGLDHTLEIKNIGTGQLYVDSFEILGVGGAGNPGYIDNTDTFRLNFGGSFASAAGGRGGTMHWSNSASAFVSFDINLNAAVAGEGFVLYHYNGIAANYKVCVTDTTVAPTACAGGTSFSTVGVNGRRFITETDLGLTGVTGARRIVLSPTGDNYIGFDAVMIVGNPNGLDTLTLATGLYEDYDPNIRRFGTWTTYSIPQAVGGNSSYINDLYASMMFNVDSATQGVAVYTTNAASYASFELCIYSQTATAAQDDVCQTFNTASASTAYGRVNVLRLPTGIINSARMVEIRVISGGFLAIEGIRLLGAISDLDNGTYDDAQTLDLNFSSGWVSGTGSGRANTTTWSNSNSQFFWFEMNFTSSNEGEGLVIYTNAPTATTGVNICVTAAGGAAPTTGCSTPTHTYLLGTNTRQWVTETQLGTAATNGVQRIIISPSGSGWFGFDGITLVGPGNSIGGPLNLAGGSPAGFYEPEEAFVLKVGAWSESPQAGALGGDTHFAQGVNNALLFNVDSATQGVAVYTTNGSGYATGEVCIYSATNNASSDDACTAFNTNAAAGQGVFIVRIPSGTTTVPAGATRLVEIRITSASAYMGVQGIRLLSAVTPLPFGYYEDSQVTDLNYSAAGWLPVASGRGGTSRWTNSAAADTFVWFEMNFTAANDGEGIVIYNVPGFGGAGVNVCVVASGGAAPTNGCTVPAFTTNFGANTRTWISESLLAMGGTTGTQRIIISPSSASGSGQWFGFDGITLVGQSNTIGATLTLAGGSPTGFYEPENAGVLKVGTWTESADAAALGGDTHFATGVGQALLFNVDSATQGVAVYTTNGSGYATGEVCVYSATNNVANDDACLPFNTNAASMGQGIFFVRIPTGTTTTPAGATRLVEIRITSAAYLGVQGFRLLAGSAPLPFGYYEDSQTSDLNYSATGWTPVAAGRGNVSQWTNSAAVSTFVWFEMNFTAANEGEGIVIYNFAGFPTGGVNVCVIASGGAAPINGCPTLPTTSYQFGTNTRRFLNETDLGVAGTDGSRRIILSPSSTAGSGQWFGFDGITLVGQGNTIGSALTLAGGSPTGFYEPENANVQRVGSWAEVADSGALGGDSHRVNSVGQSMLFNVDSSTQGIAIYTTNGASYATGELCVYNATNNSDVDDVCTTFSTNGTGTGGQLVRIPASTTTTPAGANRLVELRTTSTGIMAVQGIRLVGTQTALAPGYYPATEIGTGFNLTFNGTWIASTTASGNPIRFTNSGTATFLWNVLPGRNDRLLIYRSTASGYGNIEVCVNGNCATVPNSTTAASGVVSNFITKANVGLNDISDTGDFLVTIRVAASAPGYIALEGIQILTTAAPLAPGYYEETLTSTNYNLNFSPTGWSTVAAGRGGNSQWTNSAASSTFAWFEMNADATKEGEGIVLYVGAGFPTAGVNVCVTAAGGAAPTNGCTSATYSTQFGTNSRIWITEAQLGINSTTGGVRVILSPSSTAGSGQWFALEGLFIMGQTNNVGAPLTLVGGSPTGFYEPEAVGVTRVGNWTEYADASALGGDTHWIASDRQSMLFNVDSATRGIAVYTTNMSGTGTIEVCIYSMTNTVANDDTCQTFNTASSVNMTGVNVVRIPSGTTTAPVGAARVVEIRTTSSSSVGIQGFRLLDNPLAMTPGFYQSTDINVTFSAGWTNAVSSAYDGGAAQYTNVANATMSFSIGGANGATTGFVLYTTRASWTAPLIVCYDRVSDPADNNLTPALGVGTCEQVTTVIAGSTVENVYGLAFYGLPSRTLDTLSNETYNITIKNTGTAAQYLYVDAINVLAAPTTSLVAGVNDNTSAAIIYSPASRWIQGNTSTTTLAGGIAQTRFTGNSLIVYGSSSATGSNNIRFCVVVPNTTSPTGRLQCGTVRQNGVASYTPTILYGFGSGSHDVVFDNRAPGMTFTIDSLVPR